MNPANNLEKLHDQIVALNRALKLSSEERVTEAGRTWVFRTGQEALPLSVIQRIIPNNLKLDDQQENMRTAVELLSNQVQRLYDDTPAKRIVLDRLNDILPSRSEGMLDEIEKGLPPDCFAPFKRNEHGLLITPEEQLEKFRKLLNSNPLRLELTAEKPLTAQDYIRAATRVVDHDFVVTFWDYLPPELQTGPKAQEAREFIKGLSQSFTNLTFVSGKATTIPPEIAFLDQLTALQFTGYFHLNSRLIPHSVTRIDLQNWIGEAVPNWIYAMPNLRVMEVGNLTLDLRRLSHIKEISFGSRYGTDAAAERKSPLPADLFTAKHLAQLSLSNVSREPLPAEIGNLDTLEVLVIRNNQFRTLPPELGNLKALIKLSVERNRNLSQLPAEIGKLKNLEELNIQYQPLETLPEEIGELTKLKHLTLIGITNFLQFPDSLGKLQSLEWLHCDTAIYHLLPDSLAECSKLKMITLLPEGFEWRKEGGIPIAEVLKQARKSPQKEP